MPADIPMTNQTDIRPYWIKLLPGLLRARIEHRPNLVKVMSNTGWLFSDRILRMGVGLLVGVWVARYRQDPAALRDLGATFVGLGRR